MNPQEQAIFNVLSKQRAATPQRFVGEIPQGQRQPKQKKGNFFTDLIPTATSILGGIGGTFFGGPVGTVAGGAGGAALGTKLRNMLTGEEDKVEDYLGEAALGSLGGIGGAVKTIGSAVKAGRAGEGTALDILRGGAKLGPQEVSSLSTTMLQPAQQFVGDRNRTLAKNVLSLMDSEATNKAAQGVYAKGRNKALGSNVIALTQNQNRKTAINQADEAERFNELARQNIQRLAQERMGQGLPLPGGGLLSKPGAAPSFATEGIELRKAPAVPSELPLTQFPSRPQPARAPLTQPPALEDYYKPATNSADVLSTPQPGMAQRTADSLRRSTAGTGKAADTFTQEQQIVDTLRRRGLSGSGANLYKNVDSELGKISSEVQDKLGTITTSAPRSQVVNNLRKDVATSLPDDAAYTRELDRSLQRISRSSSGNVGPQELFSMKQELGNRLGPAFKKMDKGAPLTIKEEADMELWRRLDNQITALAPEVKDLTLDQSRLITGRTGVKSAAERKVGIPLLGVQSQALSRGLQGAQSKAADILEKVSSTGQKLDTPLTPMQAGSKMAKVQIPLQILTGGSSNEQPAPQEPQTAMNSQNQPLDNSQTDLAQLLGGTSPSQSMYSMESAAKDIQDDLQKTGGQNVDKFMKIYQFLNPESEEKANKPLSAEAAKVVGNAESGLRSLDQVSNILASDPGVLGKTVVPFRDLFGGLGSSALGTSSYDTATKNITDVITRLRTGAALTDSEKEFYMSQLPQAFDPQETVNQKLQMFRDLFSSIASREPSYSESSALSR